MAKNKTTYTLQIDAELGNLESKISSVKGLLSGVLGSANAPKGLEKTIEKIEGLIDRVKAKASQPIDSKAGFASISKDVDSAQVALSGLLKIVQSINSLPEADRLSFLPPDAQAQIQKVIDGLSAYAAAMDAATTESQELAAARAELAKADEKVAKAQEKLDQRTANLDAAKVEKQAAEDAIQAIEERKKKLAELRAEQEKIEKFYDTPDGNGQKRNKSKKYSEVSMRPQDIKRKVADMEKAVAADDAVIDSYREQLKGAKSDVDSYIKQVSAANRALKDATTEHDALEKKVQDLNDEFEASKPKNQQAAFEALRKEASALGVSLDGISDTFSDADANELIKRLVDIKTKGLDKVGKAADKATTEVAEFGTGLKNIKDDVEEGTDALEKMTEAAAQKEAFENKIKQFLGLQGAAHLMRAALRDAIATVKELDATMTEMAVVTDLTVGDYWDQLPEYSKRASDLGVSINSAYKAATLYYQQGLKTNEVVALSNETLKMAKIAGIDAAEATDKMTAALRGFNMELNEASAKKIADVYSELAAITAADVDEISTAMTKTASIASSAGMEFETTAAFLSQIIETTRESAETAGTAMKTVIARFQELKKSPEEIGEVDGEIVDANAIETALRSVGVSLRDAGGQFRELDDVFLELSSKWSGLDKNTQRYIATIAAGSRQQSRFIAMMQDYGRTQELVTAANTSAGASQKQFEKTMESLEAKVEKLKNAWHEFTMGIANSDLVKFGVDALTKLLEIVNKATSAFGGFAGSLTKIGTVLTVFKVGKSLFQKIPENFKEAMVDVVRQAIEGGEKAAEGAAEGARRKQQELAKQGGARQGTKKEDVSYGLESKYGGFVGKVSNLGMKLSGADHFAEFSALGKERKGLKQTISKNTPDQIQQKREKLKTLNETYTVHKNGTVSKKGKKGFVDKKEAESAKNEISGLTDELKEYDEAQDKLTKNSKKQWSALSNGISSASQTLMGIGVGLSAVGSALEAAGLEGAAETFNTMSQYATTAGAVLGIIPPILSLIQALFPGVGAASAAAGTTAAASGTAASAAWGIVGVIVMIVIAAIVVAMAAILLIMAAIKNASPEAKLKKAQESAEAAEEAANNAAEAYEKLGEALDNLGDKYKALDELTKGTKEWNKAVQEINSSVLDLIGEYPELAKFVENKEGVLTIDVESSGVQEVLQEAEARKIATKNTSTMANVAVSQASNDVAYSNLDKGVTKTMGKQNAAGAGWGVGVGAALEGAALGASYGSMGGPIGAAIGAGVGLVLGGVAGAFAGPAAKKAAEENNEKVKQSTDELAKALASGEILPTEEQIAEKLEGLGYLPEEAKKMAKELAENADELRSYGESLNATDAQQQAAYDAIAFSAQSLANTLDMTAEQIQQSAVLVDGETSERFYNEKKNELDKQVEEDSGRDIKDLSKDDKAKAAIEQQYGLGAYMDKKGNVYDKKGEKIDKLTSDELIAMMSTQYATEQTAKAIEYSDEAIAKVAETLGTQLGGATEEEKKANADLAKAAVNAMYMQNEGDALTQAQLRTLQNQQIDYQGIWDSLSLEEQLAYGNDIENLKDDFSDAISFATEAFGKAGDAARDFMTADMAKGFKNKLDEVAKMAGGEINRQSILDATDQLLQGKNEDKQREIQSRINMADWSSLESLLALQLDLQYEYGYSEIAAKAYVDALGAASYATSSLTATVKTFGDLWKATEKINQSMTRLTNLQWEYDQALKNGGGNIKSLTESMLAEYALQANQYAAAYEASNNDIAKLYAQGGLNYSVDMRDFVKLGNNGVEVDRMALQDAIDSGKVSEEDATSWIDSLTEQYATSQEQIEGLQSTLDNIEELEQQGREAYYELRNMAKEAILDSLQKQIDLQQETLDATRDANAALLNKLQEQINDSRQTRENQKTEKNISKLQSQQAYLAMDTSGANALETQNLNKQIEEAEQAYQDQLIDQAIQNLQDANAKAEEQRERQIALAESSLEAYELSNEFQANIDSQLTEMLAGGSDWQKTGLGQLMTDKFTEAMSAEEKQAWADEIGAAVGQASTWINTSWGSTTNSIKETLGNIKSKIDTLATDLVTASNTAKLQSQKTELISSGFAKTSIESMSEDDLNTLYKFSSKEDSGGTSQGSIDKLNSVDANYKTQAEYYQENMEKILNGETVSSYEGYLSNKLNEEKESAVAAASTSAMSHKVGLRGFKDTDAYKDQLEKYTKLGGTQADFDEKLKSTFDDKPTGHFPDNSGATIKVNDALNVKDAEGNAVWTRATAKINGSEITSHFVIPTNGNGGRLPAGVTPSDLSGVSGGTPQNGWVVMYEGEPYVYYGGWRRVQQGHNIPEYNEGYKQLKSKMIEYLTQYKTGGLADFTGPAWLDGTPSRPEYILNAAQTERFFSLIDVLEGYDTKGKTEKPSGDNYFDIDINVEKIDNDYDMEQIADKIRRMIYEDATYRNVNAINHIR